MKVHDGIPTPGFANLRPGDERYALVFVGDSAGHAAKVAGRLNPPGRVVPVIITIERRKPRIRRTY